MDIRQKIASGLKRVKQQAKFCQIRKPTNKEFTWDRDVTLSKIDR